MDPLDHKWGWYPIIEVGGQEIVPKRKRLSFDEIVYSKKAIWKSKSTEPFQFYCPVCKAERRIPCNPNPETLTHIVKVLITTAFTTLICWPLFSWKGLVSIFPIWTLFELYFRTNVRSKLMCPHCAFDPYLYLVDIKKARNEIEVHFRRKFEDLGIPYPESDAPAQTEEKIVQNPNLTGSSSGS